MVPISVKELVACTKGKLLCGSETDKITSVTTNSREIEYGALFVPVIGEKVDAHDFMEQALRDGATAVFTSRHKEFEEGMQKAKAYIYVEDTIRALQDAAAYSRSRFDIPIVGITGSVGKTTTKEMIACVLETEKNVLKTAGNMNSQVGLSLMMFRIEEEHDVAVIEMGVSEPGEMQPLADIAKPCFAVITNIGVSHISQFKTKEKIAREKMNIINRFGEIQSDTLDEETLYSEMNRLCIKKVNVLFLNGDDPLLKKVAEYKKNNDMECDLEDKTKEMVRRFQIITFGTDIDCDYRAENITTKEGKSFFEVAVSGKKETVVLQVLGIHNVYNALVSIAVGQCFGIDFQSAKQGLLDYRPLAMRGTITNVNGITIIDDTYNASPDSMKSGINVLLSLEGVEKRVAVLADILELGEASYACHYEVGEYIANLVVEGKDVCVDEVITVGSAAKAIVQAIRDKKVEIATISFDSNEEASVYLKRELKKKTAIIVKGSRGMRTDEIIKFISVEQV